MIELLVATVVGAILTGLPLVLALRFVTGEAHKSRQVAQADAVAQQTYITELQNRVLAHDWTEFAQLQQVPGPTEQAAAVLNSFGEQRDEAAYGESEQDVVERLMAEAGISLEGPTIG